MYKPLRFVFMKYLWLFFLVSLSQALHAQRVLPENLGPKAKVFWDANNKRIHSTGSYYLDEINPTTTEKHGKWTFYALDGSIEEERFFYRNRMHGKQTTYFPNKQIKQQYFAQFNVPDSTFKEYDDKGILLIQGNYQLGSPEGIWNYNYSDASRWKTELVRNDTTYLLDYFENDSLHTQTVVAGKGQVNTYYTYGGLKESYTFNNGLRDGPFFELLASGRPSIEGAFSGGKKQGKWLFYFPNGNIEKQQSFIQDSLDGSYQVYFENGVLQTEGSYQLGKKEGTWIWRRLDGGEDMKGMFKSNLQQGVWTYYYSSGELSYTASFDNGLKAGEWNYYYKDGTPFKKGKYESDLKQGLWQTWYEDGTILLQGAYNRGEEEGEWKNFWPNGRVKNTSFYKDGKLHGAWYSFSPEGKLLLFGRYKHGNKTGKWTEFYNNGRKKEEVSYKVKTLKNASQDVVALGFKEKQSVEHGFYKAYSQLDFAIKESGKYHLGKKVGKWINFYPGGVVPAVVSTFKNGLLHGEFYQNDRRGNKMNEIHYKNGLKDGLFIVYGSNGKPITQKMFRKGHELQRVSSGNPFSPE